ncbi:MULTISPECIES: VOC family protein [unclassified Sphingobium]|uniref:VOC family protein n=1 Tax=unclassified Sphingobium TaxID=2611147 RepID=UPI00119BFBE2|nr:MULTISPECIES: VOC family protein [unclassified Sphingobium]MBG6120062.1 catechol 2,3-dioxygenase-like lactoylglutathione lyase family enzyme [Sphingobium sp. JAI105]TWD05737.1 glyoxalase/bleomycin resistance protein/dioxygenase superfamily protein [Sphingobium sp. AEW010]TWD23290.1 glyoxalase/bleomycin resistance protein/dioxygenase superfamily protein [Sphingobium sp. AEW013]TWD25150.1 glyoxalase/bleomycin resistance protein/dioxygenase superfamily protein [Sphingobium sp. AEW001]
MTFIPHLYGRFFQLGYVTRDLDTAIAAYRERFGATEFMINAPPPRADGSLSATRRIGLAYIDDVMIELIEPESSMATIYDDAVPEAPGAIALHHLGFLVDDHQATVDRMAALGYAVPAAGSFGDVLDYSYADTRADLGHYSEFIRLGEQGRQMFAAVPRNPSGLSATL